MGALVLTAGNCLCLCIQGPRDGKSHFIGCSNWSAYDTHTLDVHHRFTAIPHNVVEDCMLRFFAGEPVDDNSSDDEESDELENGCQHVVHPQHLRNGEASRTCREYPVGSFAFIQSLIYHSIRTLSRRTPRHWCPATAEMRGKPIYLGPGRPERPPRRRISAARTSPQPPDTPVCEGTLRRTREVSGLHYRARPCWSNSAGCGSW